MKKFLENNFTIIILVIAVLTFFKSCGDSRELTSIKKDIKGDSCIHSFEVLENGDLVTASGATIQIWG
jgi:hypothetical protein